MTKTMLRSSLLAVAAFAGAIAAGTAYAATPFDGGWTVAITTTRGSCDSGSSFGLQVHDGVVSGYGGFSVSGRVSPSGAVQVSISAGDQRANGTGRLAGSSGGGTWRGSGARGSCSGRWSASRSG
jgi:hypothetical protein